jgi:hypothetical protein
MVEVGSESVPPRNRRLLVTTRNVQPLAYTIDEVLRAYPIGRTKLYELLATKQIPSFMTGKRRMVRVASLEAFLLAQEQAAS